jgi:hypothetical protein
MREMNPDRPIVTKEVKIKIEQQKHPGEVVLTEGGELILRFKEGEVQSLHADKYKATVSGEDSTGNNIELKNLHYKKSTNNYLVEATPSSVTCWYNSDHVVRKNKETLVLFDVLCFRTSVPQLNQPNAQMQGILGEQDEKDGTTKCKDKYFDYGDWSVFGIPLTDSKERVEFVKNSNAPIRTGQILISQHKDGTLEHQLNTARQNVDRLLEISSLIHGTAPQCIRGKIISKDENASYEGLYVGSRSCVGSGFSQFPRELVWGNEYQKYLEEAYKGYTDQVRDDLKLRQVIGHLVDANIKGRPVEGKLLSICSAIELLAVRHADIEGTSRNTGPKIKSLLNKLNIETKDLAELIESDIDKFDIKEYFWRNERVYVSHGSGDFTVSELVPAQEATLILLKRIIRNQLLDEKQEKNFEHLYDLSPPEYTIYDTP